MYNPNRVTQEEQTGMELGTVICKNCLDVLFTLPTDGVKRFYGICSRENCAKESAGMEGEEE
ncbi:GapA-binding peptide SR1P [Paenibacillus aurantius]|uniref:GapA-binding peptide SR1P n=1 Tax=Paenibacillus aurantius TaxID=2918900 RepID=A0AA96LKZ6_9BACL|nr:GapA-binding peptide SR1P [Paenibacillus aurantius]WNQ13307.1 GapA-binding peptide SR1P [Paenibacillus aurantius]